MTYPIINLHYLAYLFIIFMRTSGIFINTPILSSQTIPLAVKATLSIILAYLVSVFILPIHSLPALSIALFVWLAITEIVIGLLIGIATSMVFSSIQFSGRLIDMVMGMHIASVLDPLTQQKQSLIGQLQYIIIILLFLTLNGHHLVIIALIKSFTLIPIGMLTFSDSFLTVFLTLFSKSFLIGVQLASPVMGTLFLVDFSLGIVARGVPQMNVFITGMPVKSLMGFFVLFLIIPYYGEFFHKIPALIYRHTILMLQALS